MMVSVNLHLGSEALQQGACYLPHIPIHQGWSQLRLLENEAIMLAHKRRDKTFHDWGHGHQWNRIILLTALHRICGLTRFLDDDLAIDILLMSTPTVVEAINFQSFDLKVVYT